MRRTLVIGLGVVVAIAVLGYAAHSTNLVGAVMSLHTPPPH